MLQKERNFMCEKFKESKIIFLFGMSILESLSDFKLQSCIEDLTWGAPDILVSRKNGFHVIRFSLVCHFSGWIKTMWLLSMGPICSGTFTSCQMSSREKCLAPDLFKVAAARRRRLMLQCCPSFIRHIWFLLLHLIAEYQIYLGSISKILFLMCPSIIVWNLIQSKHKSSLFILHWLWHFRKWDSS